MIMNEVYSPQRATHTKTSSREDLFIEVMTDFHRNFHIAKVPEPVPEQFFLVVRPQRGPTTRSGFLFMRDIW